MRLGSSFVTVGIVGAALTGCGATAPHHRAAPLAAIGAIPSSPALAHATSTATSGRVLISFRRVFGTDPAASTLTVYAGGRAVATAGYGGRNGLQVYRFRMSPAQLRHLRALVPATPPPSADAGDFHGYIYWIITDRGSYRLRTGAVPPAARPLIAELNAITDAHAGS